MNTKRLAELFRQRAALDLEIAAALEGDERAPTRKRPVAKPDAPASSEHVEAVRRQLRRKGIAA